MRKTNDNAGIEDQWNKMQIGNTGKGLNTQPPNENDVHRNISNTSQIGNVSRMKILTPLVFGALNPNDTRDLQSLNNTVNVHEIKNNYRGMIIGNAHATVVFKLKRNNYIHYFPSPSLSSVYISRATTIKISPAVDLPSSKIIGILAQGFTRKGEPSFTYGGDFVIMIG
jgi:hypothetical protein